MISRRLASLVLAGLLLWPAVSRGQEGTVKIAVCNLTRVFQQLDEAKVIEDRMRNEQTKAQVDSGRMQQEIKDLQTVLRGYKPGSVAYMDNNAKLTKKIVEYVVWARVTELQMQRTDKEFVKALFDKVREASKEVAEKRKIDVVFNERRPELGDMEKLKPQDVRAIILQNDVLYMNQKVDITDDVILLMNQKYQASGGAGPTTKPAP